MIFRSNINLVKVGTMSVLKDFINGMSRALVLVPDARAYRVESQGFMQDSLAMRGDFKRVGDDLALSIRIATNTKAQERKPDRKARSLRPRATGQRTSRRFDRG